MSRRFASLAAAALLTVAVSTERAEARNPIRRDFFDLYPAADGTQIETLPGNASHCGACHFDFDGGGPRNPYGLAVQGGIEGGLSNEQAILAIENDDSDADGFSNLVEITDLANFGNTPTFPGLSEGNKNATSNIPIGEIEPHLTPSGGSDVTPPVVTVTSPNGGNVLAAGGPTTVLFTAIDASGISHVNIFMSDDGGSDFEPVAKNEPYTGMYSWFVPNLPGTETRIRVEAVDNAGNPGADDSDSDFTITGILTGVVPTTLRDMKLPGSQPLRGAVLEDPALCFVCHGDYDLANEPGHNWKGSMMGQAMRDPLFLACMAVAEQDAPSVGDLCIRCHSPGGWQEGRSVDTSGGLINAKDREAIQCDFCHRMVDWDYTPGIDPPEDLAVLSALSDPPFQYANGEFINDPAPLRRGPYADGNAPHQFLESPVHRSSDICGTCHDVSNPVFVSTGPGTYAPATLDEEHPDMDLRNMFPVERTYSEWTESEYATVGVFAPQFAGNKPDGIVSSCQDCHMRDVNAKGCNQGGAPTRADLPLHDFTGGNTFIPDILPDFFPNEVDVTALQDAKQRATSMLQLAASLELTPQTHGLDVRVTNETGHKLPSGYPEGRRIWLNVRAVDGTGVQVFESGAYDLGTAVLTHDEQAKVYEIKPGLSPGLAGALGMPAGVSFHFVLNDTVYSDNRIPPRGFTNAGFESIQSPPVAYNYADGQYWDDTSYFLPATAETAHVTLYYQTLTKEYVEFLRDANTTNSAGQDLYDAWEIHGKSTPVAMAQASAVLGEIGTAVDDVPETRLSWGLESGRPNPFRYQTTVAFSLAEKAYVRVAVYDLAGRRVRTLVNGELDADRYEISWNGRDQKGRELASGVYFVRFEGGPATLSRKIVLLN
jgi:hypothetical protein